MATSVLVVGLLLASGCAPATPEAVQESPKAVAAGVADTQVRDPHTFVAYYFHRTLRCQGCLWIEAQARRVVEEAFADELRSGRVSWQATNIDLDENRHFEKDFSLESSTLVLADFVEGQIVRWKALGGVWEFVEKEPEFDKYVTDEVSAWLGKQSG